MLKNNDIVIKNGDNIIKSQVVDSYIKTSDYYVRYYISTSGLTYSDPLKIYFKSSTGLYKNIYSVEQNESFIMINTYSNNIKDIYVFGNLDAVLGFRFQMLLSSPNYTRETGDLKSFINQFKNLEKFSIMSSINQDFTYYSLPKNIKYFEIDDTLINGNINYIENFNNIEELKLTDTKFSGNLSNINFNNFKSLYLDNNTELLGDLTSIVNDNNLEYLYIDQPRRLTSNLSNMDVSNLNYILLDIAASTTTNNIYGDISNWEFNTGLTYFRYNNTSTINNQIYGDLSDWDISNTLCNYFYFQGYTSLSYRSQINGDLSQWQLPDNMISFYIIYADITNIPYDFSNTGLNDLIINYTKITSINNLIFPDKDIYSINLNYNNIVSISGITFPSISRFNIAYQSSLIDDINDINFSGITNISVNNNSLTGNINDFIMPDDTLWINFRYNNIGGYISGITFNDTIQTLYLSNNNIYGSIVGMTLPDSLNGYLLLSNNNIYIDFDEGEFFTNQLYYLYLDNISGITGDLSNFIIGDRLMTLYLHSINDSYTDLSKLKIGSNISTLHIYNTNFYGDLTNWLTGTTINISYQLYFFNNPNISGDTSNWNITSQTCYLYNSPQLTGRLKHNNVYDLRINGTSTTPMNLTSNIAEDFNLSNRMLYFRGEYGSLTGNLSGVTLYSRFRDFYINNNPDIYGSNEFIDYIFTNRNVFTGLYSISNINIANIGDSVSGTTETLGDLGTYTGSEWDLSEIQVNNLANGLDYDGNGSNTEWSSKEKIYWIKNAQISSSNTSKRYITYNITY